MSEQTTNILNNIEDTITNYYVENLTLDNKNNTITPTIKKIDFIKDLNYKTLTQRSSNYLKNLEIYKNLPDSIVTNILKSRKYISHNHNILFHHFSKDKKINKKNSGKIQSIIINTNLRTLNKDKIVTKESSNKLNPNIIYYKKNLIKSKSTINTHRQSKKNYNTSQSSIIANYDTNYDYDFDNDNYINFNDNSEKFNLLEKKNCFTDISLKEYLFKETKPLKTAFNYFENNKNEKIKEKKEDESKDKLIQTDNFDIKKLNKKNRANSIIDIKIQEFKNRKRKYSFCKTNKNSGINNKCSDKIKYNNISYTNRYKMEKNKFKSTIGNNNIHLKKYLLSKSCNYLSSNGNFTIANEKRRSFFQKEEEKNNYFKRKKLNIFINTQNFYNDSKIDYISFRKNNLNSSNKLFSKQKNKHFLKHKEKKRIPCKLIKKDLIINTSTSKIPLTKKLDSISRRNLSMEPVKNKNNKFKKSPNSERRIGIKKEEKPNKKGELKEKIENNKKKLFEFKKKLK